MTPLCVMAEKWQTDKGGNHYHAGDTCHTYTEVYHELFKDRREQVKNVLEVGVNYGPSLRMWKEYFPNAKIFGLDCAEHSMKYSEDRIQVIMADQGSAPSLYTALSVAGVQDYDFIIDDGSHELHHQILTANVLLPFLAPGGVYIIEDIALDCTPSSVTDHIIAPAGYRKQIIPTRMGLGKAHCDPNCPHCHGESVEQLIAYFRD